MTDHAQAFKKRLINAGLSSTAIDAAWPEWWSEAADSSTSAQAELRFTIARKLGLDPRSLISDEAPRFMWSDDTKYKNFSGTQNEQQAISSFGVALGKLLIRNTGVDYPIADLSADYLRATLLGGSPFIDLHTLISLLWAIGIPVIHLRIYPLPAKRMCAMAVKANNRYAILLAKDSDYPASTIFHLAHEIGHIALGHLNESEALIDMDDPIEHKEKDEEEAAADRYALSLLTGSPDFGVINEGAGRSSRELAEFAMGISTKRGIEPGTFALCYGFTSGDWPVAIGALKHIYTGQHPVWQTVNKAALSQIIWENLDDESGSYLYAVTGAPQ